jgi:hypothetical protein
MAGCITFTSDGKALAVADEGIVRVWDTRTGKELCHYPEEIPEPNPDRPQVPAVVGGMYQLAFTPNGKLMLTLGVDVGDGVNVNINAPVLRVWETASRKERQHIHFKDLGVFSIKGQRGIGGLHNEPGSSTLTISPDSRCVAITAGSDIRLIDLVKGKEIRRFGAEGEMLTPAIFSPDGTTIAAGATDGSIRVWDVTTGVPIGEFHGHRGAVTTLVYAANGKTLASGGVDTTALIWDVPSLMDSLKVTPRPLPQRALEQLIRDLAAEDMEKAGKAVAALVQMPKEALPLLKERLRPAAIGAERKVDQFIRDLSSDDFDTRKSATEALENLGDVAEPALLKRLEEKPELEVQKRIEELLEKLQKPETSSEILSMLRMIEILEHMATPEARKLLEEVSKGAEGARSTREAKAAVERLTQRTGRARPQ